MQRYIRFDLLVAFLAIAAAASPAWAQKGGKTPPPPAGTIFFAHRGELLGFDANGANVFVELPAGSLPAGWLGEGGSIASNLDYGGRRWFVSFVHDGTTFLPWTDAAGQPRVSAQYEVYAYRRLGSPGSNAIVQWIKLTDFLSDDIYLPGSCRTAWSNDGHDSFISFTGRPLVDGARDNAVYVLALSGRDLDAIADAELLAPGTWQPLRAGSPLVTLAFQGGLPSVLAGHQFNWNPAGDRILINDSNNFDTYLRVLGGDAALLLDHSFSAHWSPTAVPGYGGERILYHNSGNITGQLWTVKPDGTDPRLIVKPAGNILHYYSPCWSPDCSHVAMQYADGNGNEHIARISSSGDKRTLLKITPTGVGAGWLHCWRSNVSAYVAP